MSALSGIERILIAQQTHPPEHRLPGIDESRHRLTGTRARSIPDSQILSREAFGEHIQGAGPEGAQRLSVRAQRMGIVRYR